MRDSFLVRLPLAGLLRDLSNSIRMFFREELELVKSEMSEKISSCGRNATSIAIGGFVAYAGLIVLLGGVGILIGWAFQKTNMDPALANVIGLGGVGLVVILAGAAMVLKGVKAFSTSSLKPQRTLDTIKHLNGANMEQHPELAKKTKKDETPKRSPDELKAEVFATEEHIGETLQEIAYRTSPARLKKRAVKEIQAREISIKKVLTVTESIALWVDSYVFSSSPLRAADFRFDKRVSQF